MSQTDPLSAVSGVEGSHRSGSLVAEGNHAGALARLDQIGMRIEAGFREAAAEAIRQAHAVGAPIATLDAQGSVGWRYPCGTERTTCEARQATPFLGL
jgi:hypothetical protein